MNAALSIAAAGLHGAGRQFEAAARQVVASGDNALGNPQDRGQTSAGATQTPAPGGIAAATPSSRAGPLFDTADLVTGLVDLKLAETSYKAQIAVLKAADRMQDETLDLIA